METRPTYQSQGQMLLDKNKKYLTPGLDISRKTFFGRYLTGICLLSATAEGEAQIPIKNLPSVSGIAAVLDDKLILLSVL